MRVVIAVLIGVAILGIGLGTLRGLARPARSNKPEDAVPVQADVRTTFWCETCGTELLLLRKGTDAPPRHCGEPMVKREEVRRS